MCLRKPDCGTDQLGTPHPTLAVCRPVGAVDGRQIWVTGGTGFVGSHLVPRLQAVGARVVASDREVDVTKAEHVAGFLERHRPEAIVHLAGIASVPQAEGDPAVSFRVNFGGVANLLRETARRLPRTRVLLVTTGGIYGSAETGAAPFDESAPLRPGSAYAATKAAADLLGASHAEAGLDVVRARPFNHTGPGQSDLFAASTFARQLAEMEVGLREPRLAVGSLESIRDFLDVGDVVDAYVRLLDPDVPAAAYNIASGRGVRLQEVLDTLIGLARVEPAIEVDPARLRPPEASVGDASRLTHATGWTPRTPLRETLGALLDAWRETVGAH